MQSAALRFEGFVEWKEVMSLGAIGYHVVEGILHIVREMGQYIHTENLCLARCVQIGHISPNI